MGEGSKNTLGDIGLNSLPNADLSYWAADTSQALLWMTAGDALRRTADAQPQRTALVEVVPDGVGSLTGEESTSRRWTYAQLLADAEQCAQWLLSRFRPGERVCLWAPNVPEWVIIQYGAALAGVVLVTANPALRRGELEYVLKQSKSAGLIYTAEFRGTNMAAIAHELRHLVRESLCLSDWHNEVKTFMGHQALPKVDPKDPAQIQYTSGTTGHPKGALLHHMGLVTNASYVWARAGVKETVVVSPMPLFHTAGAVLSSLGSVVTASTYVLPLQFEPESVMAAIEREKAGIFFGVPTMQVAVLEHPRRNSYDLSSLEVAISGGAPVPPELLRRVEVGLGCELLAVYGQTEASPIICQTKRGDSPADKANTAGQPLPQVEVQIANPGSGQVLKVGEEGEIQARGYQCMLEYFDMPEATRQTLTEDGWLRTGDLGVMDDRGYVRVTGRLKDMIIRGGENVYPAELEARILEHPGVMNTSVFGAPDDKWGEVVCAALQLRPGVAAPSSDELRAHCRETLAPHKVPTRWLLCKDFPMTGSGKVQKFRLREMLDSGTLHSLD